jgi:hypothetical protein
VFPNDADKSDTVIAEMAHIHAFGETGPRANGSLSDSEKNDYSNLILLCGDHHTLVDNQAENYPADLLRKWKADHEEWVRNTLEEEMPNITFAELDVVCAALASGNVSPSDDYDVLPPQEKIEKNNLSEEVAWRLRIGIGKAPEVEAYVSHQSKVDPQFGSRLKKRFVDEYDEMQEKGLAGDDLYYALESFACQDRGDIGQQAAAIAVLAYLFQKCEVFEK